MFFTIFQSKELAGNASHYLRILIPSLWSLSCSTCIQNWLHSQSKPRAIAVITLIVACFHPIWCYTYIYYLKFGYLGAALAVTTSKLSELVLLTSYIYIYRVYEETGFKFSSDCFQGWGAFLLLGKYIRILCTVYCVLCTVYCVLCTEYCVLCTVYCVLCTV